MGLFYRNDGAISVFLTLILLPVLIFTGMVTDFTRIYGAKTQVSDSGEMAMNGALSQYSYVLKDMYGLLAMEESPSDIEDTLEEYFVQTLEGSLDGYSQLIDIESLSFAAYDVEGSELYIPEVVRQQIVEYMKYRAPVSIVSDLLEKFELLQGSEATLDAADAQMEYAKELSDCQDELEDLYNALNSYNEENKDYTEPDYQEVLDDAQEGYEEATEFFVRYAFIDAYEDKNNSTDVQWLVEEVILLTDDMKTLTSDSSIYTKCFSILNIDNQLNYLGGVDELEPSEELTEEEIEDITSDYESAIEYIDNYKEGLKTSGKALITEYTDTIDDMASDAAANIIKAEKAIEALDDYLESLDEAEEKWNEWGDAVEEIPDSETQSTLQLQVDEQGEILGQDADGAGSDELRSLLEGNLAYFNSIVTQLETVSYYSQGLTTVAASTQSSTYLLKAESASASGSKTAVDDVVSSMMGNYITVSNFTVDGTWKSIENNGFYAEIIELYENSQSEEVEETEDGEDDMNEAESYLENKEGATVNEYTWGEDGTLPSQVESVEEDEEDPSAATDIGTGSSYKATVEQNQDALDEARDLLAGMEEIFTDQLENLYISEYIMQMFTYYTITQDGEGGTIDADTLYSATGYPLGDNAAFGSEIEYILWGSETAQENVDNTLAMTFAFRMLFNTITAFTDPDLITVYQWTSTTLTVAAPYLYPIVYVCTTLGGAVVETMFDQEAIESGKGVTIIKNYSRLASENTWVSSGGDNTKDISLNYEELLQLFLIVSLNVNGDAKVLRVLDCIEVNLDGAYSIVDNGYTMVGISSELQVRTTFLKTIELGISSSSVLETDYYQIEYESILGY